MQSSWPSTSFVWKFLKRGMVKVDEGRSTDATWMKSTNNSSPKLSLALSSDIPTLLHAPPLPNLGCMTDLELKLISSVAVYIGISTTATLICTQAGSSREKIARAELSSRTTRHVAK